YGLATGGKRFTAALLDHPELSQLTGNAHFMQVYVLALQEIIQHPLRLIAGMLNHWGLFFSFTWYSVYGYMISETTVVTQATRGLLYGLCLAGLIRCLRTWRNPHHLLLLFASAGLILSVPFVPPLDAYGVRLYAATMPIAALLPALGISFARGPLAKYFPLEARNKPLDREYSVVFAVLLVAAVILSPLLTKTFSRLAEPALIGCPVGSEAVYVRFLSGSSVNVLPEAVFFLDRLPNYHAGRFRQQIHGLPVGKQMDALERLEPPMTIYETVDLVTLRPVWLVIDPAQIPQPGNVTGICGTWNSDPDLETIGLFDAQ
ncbi:MAG: hypothetical protein IH586_22790, partial [Anaerolineaceae bacterium]|nr:hypothetical protein [Anaerolineaceae bacterium]